MKTEVSHRISAWAGAAVVLAAATLVVYWPVGGYQFVNFDDNDYVTGNYHVRQGLTWEGVKWAFTSFDAANWHPVTWLSHMLDVSVFGMRAGGHHLVNVGLHTLNVLLLLAFLGWTTRRLWCSVMVAGLFALHPLHVESVAWISERKDVLSTVFWMLTMLAYVSYARKPGLWRYLLVAACFATGLMCKPMLVTLPVVLLLLDYWPLARLEPRMPVIRRLVVEKVPLVMLVAASAGITLLAQRRALASLELFDWLTRVTNAIISYGRYIGEMFRPVGLAAYYPHAGRPEVVAALVVLMLLAGFTALVMRGAKGHKYLVTGWAWYLVTLLPVIGIIQVGDQSHADRYTYVPLVGLFIAIVWSVARLVEIRPLLRPVAVAGGAAVLLVAGMAARYNVGFWQNDISLFGRAADVTANNAKMLANMGSALLSDGKSDQAMAALSEAVRIKPEYPFGVCALGNVFFAKGEWDKALQSYIRAIELKPDMKEAHVNAATLLLRYGRYVEAEDHLRQAITLDPYLAESHMKLGVVLHKVGRDEESLTELRKAISLNPSMAAAHYNVGVILLSKQDFAGAADEFAISARMAGGADSWTNLGNCLLMLNKPAEAEKAYREGVKSNPNDASLRYNLGIFLERTGRRGEAVAEIRKAAELDPQNEVFRAAWREITGGAR